MSLRSLQTFAGYPHLQSKFPSSSVPECDSIAQRKQVEVHLSLSLSKFSNLSKQLSCKNMQ